MNKYITYFTGLFRFSGNPLNVAKGTQSGLPSSTLIEDVTHTSVDSALQISAVWRGVEILSKLVSTMPIMVYENKTGGMRTIARESSLWYLLHTSPNSRMTPCEFWCAMMLNYILRGNAYARLDRDAKGEVVAMWPMSADQVEFKILDDGTDVYLYKLDNDIAVLSAENVLHIKEMGNGLIGLSRLDHMKVTLGEVRNSQTAANKLFANGGKPTGMLMIDSVLKPEQRQALKESFAGMTSGSTARLFVLEANMKFQQLNLTPEDMQLLATRQFNIQEIGRWFGLPAIWLNQTEGTTTLGSSSGEVIDSAHKLTIRPIFVAIEQALAKRVLTTAQRMKFTVEYNMDALLRASLKDRTEIYAKQVQNGIKSRNEVRQLENDAPFDGGDVYTAQSNLVPVNMLGNVTPNTTVATDAISQ